MPLVDEYILLSDLFTQHPQTVAVFLKYNMLCVGCLVASFHTIQDACMEYDLDATDFRRDLSAAITTPISSGTTPGTV